MVSLRVNLGSTSWVPEQNRIDHIISDSIMNAVNLLYALVLMLLAVSVYSFQQLHQHRYASTSAVKVEPLSNGDLCILPRKTSSTRTQSMMYMTKKGATDDKPAIEPKYLAAIGLVLFGALYDFFVTHHGIAYLAHP